ncbi:tellurite resistance TerB family protein [Advenella sp. RU8]|uniref:tellurite resistance TerB family protein n=1 Tax=Advenella sp. RU8 TaxID=3399575 RepID=UPI003AAF24A8
MSIQNVLQQLMQSAQGLLSDQNNSQTKPTSASGGSSGLKGFAGGALTGGALALLMGNKKFRKIGGKVATYGGVAALGAAAYHAYGQWKENQNQASQPTTQPVATPAPTPAQIAHDTKAFSQQPVAELEKHSKLVLIAMISAAKADGHINADEQRLLEAEFDRLNASPDEHAWIRTQINSPADPAAVAKQVETPEQAAEVYMASVLVNGADSFMERAYLDELARQLGLEESLKTHLENSALSLQQ